MRRARRILFVVFPQAGHLNPFIGVAQHLERKGHTLTFFGGEVMQQRLAAARLSADVASDGSTPRENADSAALTKRMRDPAFAERLLRHALVDRLAPQVERLRDVIRDRAPELICVDSMAYAGAIAAELAKVPWASASTNFITAIEPEWRAPYLEIFGRIDPVRRRQFRSMGVDLATRASDVISPLLNLIFATDAFVDLAAAHNNFSRLVGPSFPLGVRGDEVSFPWEKIASEDRVVYASFGSQASPSVDQLRAVIASVSPEDGRLVLSAKDQLSALGALPSHVLAVPYAPQLELIKRADVVITSGGANSVNECLAAGRPMLVIPFVNDQDLQAELVARCGAGIHLAAEALNAEVCGEALRRLSMPDSSYRRAAMRVAESYRLADGASEAASLLERAIAIR
jgi:MGT family glycosyltransferase